MSSGEVDVSTGSDMEEKPVEVVVPKKVKGRPRKTDASPKKTPEKKSYRCDRCNFSSSSKAKYTKHAKSAHSGTIVQCDHCEFKTPYKWNLDRHYKNHLGGGALCCHLCNFSCDIKQSLTVHLQNHHSNVPEEIIESVKRQQIPSRNSKNNNNVTINNNVENDNLSSSEEKKVPPLRISRSLTGLSLGDENISEKDEDESPSPIPSEMVASNEASSSDSGGDEKRSQKCEMCDFEISGDGGSIMKKHMATQHNTHHKSGKHKDHHKKRAPSSSPEYQPSKPSPNLLLPHTLPPKSTKGATVPKVGAPAESMSPSLHRSQSPLKATEAIHAYSSDMDTSETGLSKPTSVTATADPQTISTLPQQTQSNTEKGSAFTAPGHDFSPSIFSSLKKPKQRALASFYEKINQKLSSASSKPADIPVETAFPAAEEAQATFSTGSNAAATSTVTTKSNRCQYCRQRCKSSVDLATHLEKCSDARVMRKGEGGDEIEQVATVKVATEKADEGAGQKVNQDENFQALPKPPSTTGKPTPTATTHKGVEIEEAEEGDDDSKVQLLNGSSDSDGLIGFETAPGVGAIHTGKMDEMEYQGYPGTTDPATECREVEEGNGNQSSPPGNDDEEEEDDDAEEAEGNECVMKGGKSMITTRKVYRCPEADCTFWATTASRFHVHIVGHYNLKPFECSECHYKSNWRWDVNKHIRLKTPKDTKHAKAKTLLTHESGQRDYRKYDNYLVTMALTHSANAKAPDCSTVASKRTRNTVSTPKSSPELPTQKEGNVIITNEDVIAPHTPASSKQKGSKSGKVSGTSSSSSHSTPTTAPQAEQSTSFIHPSSGSITQHQEESSPLAADMASSSTSPGGGNKSEGRSFVETRMHAGGEIYQTSIMKQDQDMKHGNDEVDQEEMEVDNTPSGVDLTLKRPCPREDDLESQEVVTMHTQQMPKKKSRLQQHQREDPGIGNSGSGATNGSKTQSMWQCIKCSFKHPNKDVVNSHILELHKPKKGDPVSLLSHNHLIQVLIPEQDTGRVGNNDENTYSLMKEAQQMYTENGKVLSCKHCPFTTGLLYEMEIHVEHHCSIRSNNYFSCPHCSYSVPVKSELQEHLKLHGDSLLQLKHQAEIQNKRINSSTVISSTTELKQSLLSPTSTTPEPLAMKKQKKYNCMECPYTTNSIGQFHYHTQSHEPRDYPFKCHRCSFNVSVKLHLLQHLRVHGIQIDEIGIPLTQQEYNDAEDLSEDTNAQQSMEQEEPLNLSIFANRKPFVVWDANGIPMEMYRCQVCPQVFQDLNDLREHEFVNNHRSSISNGSSNSRQCDSPPCEAVNLSLKSNSKKSSQSNHKVNTPPGSRSVTNTSSTAASSTPVPILSPTLNIESGGSSPSSKSERESLYLCDECPARFFFEKELKIHHTFHENKSTFQCPKCSYSARQKDPHLMSHMRVHGSAYQEKTKTLLVRFPKAKVNFGTSSITPSNLSATSILSSSILNAAGYFQSSFGNSGVSSMMRSGSISPPEQSHHPEGVKKNGLSIVCPKCPEKFYSPTTYQQHIGLHGNPTEFRCRYCDYCAHSRKSLTVHELVHTGSADLSMESSTTPYAGSLSSGKSSSAFSPVSMMALVAHQDSAFSAAVSTGDNGNDDKNTGPVPDEAYEGNPEFVYPTYMKNGRVKSKRYKCMKCPSAFEKKDQYHTHIGLHGSNQKYKCTVCDYAVTYYANYIQHLKKHESQRNIPSDLLNPKALAKKGLLPEDDDGSSSIIPKMLKLSDVGENSVNSNGSLDSIESQHSGGKCSFCPFQCFDDATLEAHLIHHQENQNWLHVCNICTFRTSSKKSLKEHSKLHLLSSFQNFKNISQLQQQNQKFEELVVGGKVAAGFDYGKLERKQQYEQYSNGVHDQQPHRHHLPQNDNDSSNGSL